MSSTQSAGAAGNSAGALVGSSTGTSFLPGISFGAFKLGTDYLTLVRQLKVEKARYGSFTVNFPERDDRSDEEQEEEGGGDEVDQHHKFFSVSCPQVHTSFRLDRRTQRLESVIVDNVVRCGELNYKGRVLCGPNLSPTFVRMYEVLGPTFQGTMNKELGIYTLFYPGLQISFSIPEKFRELYSNGAEEGDHPLTLPDGSTPVACLIVITYAPKDGGVSNPGKGRKGGRSSPSPAAGSQVFPPICGHVYSGDTVLLSPFSSPAVRFVRSQQDLYFGMTPQDLVSVLGTPEQVYPKQDDRLLIHNPSLNAQTMTKSAPSYFFTYPLLGMDFMFDGVSNTLTKVVAFNSTGSSKHSTFLRYMRCYFHINTDFCPSSTEESPFTVTSSSNFTADVKPHLPRCPAPLLTTSGSGGSSSSSGGSSGSSLKIYCFKGTIFHMLAETGSLDSVTIFETDGVPPKPIAPRAHGEENRKKKQPVLLPIMKEAAPPPCGKNSTVVKKEPHSPYSISPASGGSPTTNYSGGADDEGQVAFVSSETTSTSRRDKESDSENTPSSAMGRMESDGSHNAQSPTTHESNQTNSASSPAFAANPTSEFKGEEGEGDGEIDQAAQEEDEVEEKVIDDEEDLEGVDPATQPQQDTELYETAEEGEVGVEASAPNEMEETTMEEPAGEHGVTTAPVNKSPWGAPPAPAAGPWGDKSPPSGLPGLDEDDEVELPNQVGGASPLPEEDLVSAPPTGDGEENATEWETAVETATEEPPSLLTVAQQNQTKKKTPPGNQSGGNGGGKKGKKGKKGKR